MSIKTFGQQLEHTQQIIEQVEINQSYSINGRTYQRADLKALGDREDKLMARVQKYGYNSTAQSISKGRTKGKFNVSFGG